MSLRSLSPFGAVFGASLLPLFLAGCPSTPGPVAPDAAVPGRCAADRDCDDGRFCNGAERCASDAGSADSRGCTPGPAPCAAADCDEAADACPVGCAEPDRDRDGADARACGGTDCDDDDADRAPGHVEVCDVDDLDEDCDPRTFGVRDLDMDGDADALCCNVAMDGMRTCGRDCDDTRAGVGPSTPEVCNAIDDDCDRLVDEGGTLTFYRDADGDGHGDPADVRTDLCGPTGEYAATVGDDCDDTDPLVFPSARELCNRQDDDCSSGGGAEPAEDVDGDGHTSESYTGCESIPSSMQLDDCNDANPDIHPGAPFQHAPSCRFGTSCLDTAGVWTCGARAATGFACEALLPSSEYTWDYDCDEREVPEEPPTDPSCEINCRIGDGTCGACAMFGKLYCAVVVPPAEAFVVAPATACGRPAVYHTCGGTPGDPPDCSNCVGTPAMLPQRCR